MVNTGSRRCLAGRVSREYPASVLCRVPVDRRTVILIDTDRLTGVRVGTGRVLYPTIYMTVRRHTPIVYACCKTIISIKNET